MSDRDRHVGGREPEADAGERLRLAVDRAVVVVVDAQNDFCDPRGRQAAQGRDVASLAGPLAALESFLPQVRRVGVPVVFIRNLHGEATDTPNWLARHATPREQSCQVGTWGAEFTGTGPVAGDLVVDKHRYSAFAGTSLPERLAELGRDSILFTGFTTNVCVESSLRDAVCHDFLATLVEDCCGAYDEAAHRRAVDAVRTGFGMVATSRRVLDVWRGHGDTAATHVDTEAVSA